MIRIAVTGGQVGAETPSAGTDTPSATRSADSNSGNFLETTCPPNKTKKRNREVHQSNSFLWS